MTCCSDEEVPTHFFLKRTWLAVIQAPGAGPVRLALASEIPAGGDPSSGRWPSEVPAGGDPSSGRWPSEVPAGSDPSSSRCPARLRRAAIPAPALGSEIPIG